MAHSRATAAYSAEVIGGIRLKAKCVTKEHLKKIRNRYEKATEGPWIASVEGRDHTSGDSVILRGPKGSNEDLYLIGGTEFDYDFIAHAKQDIPLLLGEIERLRRLLEENNIQHQ